jgi:transcription elongation factor GreA
VDRKWVLDPIARAKAIREAGGEPDQGANATVHETLITPEGLVRLEAELVHLRTTGRREAAEQLRQAATAAADLGESTEYHAAREEKALLEARIARLEDRLARVRVAEPDASNDVVDLGERVRLRNLDTGRRVTYEIVGTLEADVVAGRISAASPVGRALLGRRRGETALVEAPGGQLRFRIVAIEPAPAAA